MSATVAAKRPRTRAPVKSETPGPVPRALDDPLRLKCNGVHLRNEHWNMLREILDELDLKQREFFTKHIESTHRRMFPNDHVGRARRVH